MSISITLATLIASVASVPPAAAQNTLWQTFFQRSDCRLSKKTIPVAPKRPFASALSQAQSFGESDQRYFKSMEGLALVYSREGKYAEAEPLFQKVMAIKEKALGSDNPEVALTMGNLADLYQNQGKFSAAEVLYRGAIKGLQKGSVPLFGKAAKPGSLLHPGWRIQTSRGITRSGPSKLKTPYLVPARRNWR